MRDPSRELFNRLCAVGTALEAIRDTTYHQGALWLQLDAVLTQLDAVLETLHAPRDDGAPSRHAAGDAGEDAL